MEESIKLNENFQKQVEFKPSSGFFLILMQIKGSTVLHVLKILLTLGEKEPFGNCQWQEDREEGGKKPTMLYEGSVASSLEQPLSI